MLYRQVHSFTDLWSFLRSLKKSLCVRVTIALCTCYKYMITPDEDTRLECGNVG